MRKLITTLSLSISLAFTASADTLTLKNGDQLTGKVISSDTPGVLFLQYPQTTKPHKIKENAISRIEFDQTVDSNNANTEKILLVNGDNFPCQLQSLDEENITVKSSFMGTYSIPKNKVARIYFNNKDQNIIYEGPGKDLKKWKTTDKNWTLKNGVLSARRRSMISQQIPNLPENYKLEFTTSWTDDSPRIKVYFSSTSGNLGKRPDAYYIDLNSHGFQITRYQSGRNKPMGHTLANANVFKKKSGVVTLYVDRKQQIITLLFNGKKIRDFKNKFEKAPAGSHIILYALQKTGQVVNFSDIKVTSWNGTINLNDTGREALLAKSDVLIDTDNNPMTGKLIDIKKGADGKMKVGFQLPFAENASDIPSSKLQYIELKKAKDAKPVENNHAYTANLHSGGTLSFSNSQITEGSISFDHPILGKIKIKQNALSSIEQVISEEAKKAALKKEAEAAKQLSNQPQIIRRR